MALLGGVILYLLSVVATRSVTVAGPRRIGVSLKLGAAAIIVGLLLAESALPPLALAGGLAFVSLTAGGSHTCGVTVEATYCWGANGNGQLGNGTTTDSNVPVKVSGQP